MIYLKLLKNDAYQEAIKTSTLRPTVFVNEDNKKQVDYFNKNANFDRSFYDDSLFA